MTRSVLRHTLSTLAAVVIVSVFAAGPAFAEGPQSKPIVLDAPLVIPDQSQGSVTIKGRTDLDVGLSTKGQKTDPEAKGLATQQPQGWRWWQDYSGGK